MLQHLWLKMLLEDHMPSLDHYCPLLPQGERHEALYTQCIFDVSTSLLGVRLFSLFFCLLLVTQTLRITYAKSLLKEDVQDLKYMLNNLRLSWGFSAENPSTPISPSPTIF